MKKQTAVDWLEKFLKERYTLMDSEAIFQHAKEMYQQQIIEAWMSTDNPLQRISAEKYYKETYGKDA
jgi:hypothetical protein